MDKSTIMRTFNSMFIEFMDDIIKIFPDKRELQTAKVGFETIKKSNPTLIIKIWLSNIYTPYKNEIDNANIDFFCNKDYSNDLKNDNTSLKIMSFIDTIREPLKNLDKKNKDISIKYIQNLSKLSVLYSQC